MKRNVNLICSVFGIHYNDMEVQTYYLFIYLSLTNIK